jgi:hypothetical protein
MGYLNEAQGARREGSAGAVGSADIAAAAVTSAKMADTGCFVVGANPSLVSYASFLNSRSGRGQDYYR